MKPDVMVQIIEVPLGCAGAVTGAEKAPEVIVDAVSDTLSVPFETITVKADAPSVDKVGIVVSVASQLKSEVYKALSQGRFVIAIGGDHSISLGSICGASSCFKDDNFGVIYVDAHADMNTFHTSPTGNIHGMCLGAAMGEGDVRLTDVADTKLCPDKLLLIGSRSIDPGELEFIDRSAITVISADDVLAASEDEIKRRIAWFISSRALDRIHLSIDIDVLDPKYAPATGVPERNGLTPSLLDAVIDAVLSSGKVCSCDLVEYNPQLDTDGRTLDRCKDIISRIVR